MNIVVKIFTIGLFGVVASVQALDIFNRTTKEIEANFLKPLSDIKNTLDNTVKIFKNIETPTDKLRVAGGFMKQMAAGVDKLTSFVEFVNNKFINSVLSQSAHSKVEALVKESHELLNLLSKMADDMSMYRMGGATQEPVMRSGAAITPMVPAPTEESSAGTTDSE
jgi:hypothetical protein